MKTVNIISVFGYFQITDANRQIICSSKPIKWMEIIADLVEIFKSNFENEYNKLEYNFENIGY